jgi:predicted CXXCH cytochrome family protein
MRNTSLRPLDWNGPRRYLTTITFIAAAAALAGCEDDVVYQDRPPYNPPPAAAASFLGYYDAPTQKTTCGNCHADFQGGWAATKHAQAYNTLNSNPGKQDSCFGCHTVNGRGNAAFGTTAGWDGVKDVVYHDVQCESCHGAGQQHVDAIGQGNLIRPLAKLGLNNNGNCGDCHTGTHHPFVEEWKASRHANLNTSRASNPSCVGCHEARGAIAKWGVDANFVEKANPTDYQPPATCATCHDPHGSGNPSQLRYPVTSADPEQNLCIKCHLRRGEPEPPSTVTPHAPQGAVLLGFAGWRPPGFVYDTNAIYGSHATTKNPKLCAGCHVVAFPVTDPASGNFTFQATGHLFRPIPCLDATGKPTADKTCAYTAAARSWKSCTASGCHADANVAVTVFTNVRNRMKGYTDQLWQDLDKDGTLDAAPTDAGLLATVKQQRPTDWTNTPDITPGEGAEFNARLCGEYGASNSDNSKGVHNPFLCEALLTSTISYIKTYYGLPDVVTGARASTESLIGGVLAHVRRAAETGPAR